MAQTVYHAPIFLWVDSEEAVLGEYPENVHRKGYTSSEALEIREHLLPARHLEIAESMMVLGMILTETGELTSAECLLRDAVDIRASAFPQVDHWQVAEANSAWATCQAKLGEWEDAERLLLQSLSIFQNRLNTNHKLNRQTVQRLIELYRIRGESQNAIPDGSGS